MRCRRRLPRLAIIVSLLSLMVEPASGRAPSSDVSLRPPVQLASAPSDEASKKAAEGATSTGTAPGAAEPATGGTPPVKKSPDEKAAPLEAPAAPNPSSPAASSAVVTESTPPAPAPTPASPAATPAPAAASSTPTASTGIAAPALPIVAPSKPRPVVKPGPRVDWRYLGLSIEPVEPRVVTLARTSDNEVAVGFEARAKDIAAPTMIYDVRSAQSVKRILENEPLSTQDARGNLSALTLRGDQVQLIIHTESGGTRIARLPMPQGASAVIPYLNNPAHFAPDGALILLGSGRDRLYRINLALGEVKAILPLQPLDIVDFDVNPDGEIVALDAFEQQLVWLDTTGDIKATTLLTRNDAAEPQFYYLSVAAAQGRAAWVGVAVRQPDGSFAPEVQRLQGKLRERQRLDRGQGSLGFPLKLANDGQGGIYAVDENNWVYHVSASTQLTRAWQALPDTSGTSPSRSSDSVFLAESGAEIGSLGSAMDSVLPALNTCYDRLRQVKPGAKGQYRLQLTTRDRSIQQVQVYQKDKDFEDSGLESCVGQALRELKLATRVGHQTLRIQLQFIPAGRS